MSQKNHWHKAIVIGSAVTLVGAGCANEGQSGALIGAGAGALIGQLLGGDTKSTAIGAGIGALIGGGIGTAIMAQRAKELEQRVNTTGGVSQVSHLGESRGSKADPYEVIVASLSEQSGPVLFQPGSDRVTPAMQQQLAPMIAFLDAHPDLHVAVIGHTDTSVAPNEQVALSHRRADAVALHLLSRGVSAERIVTRGAGAYAPLDTNDTAAGRATNRRVDLVFYGKEEQPPEIRVAMEKPADASIEQVVGDVGAVPDVSKPAYDDVARSPIRPAHEIADIYTGTEEGRAQARAQQSEASTATSAPPVSSVRSASELLKYSGS